MLCSSQGTPHAGRLGGACDPRRRTGHLEGSRRTPGVEGFESLKTEEKTRSTVRSSKEDQVLYLEHVNADPTVHQLESASSPGRTEPAIGEMMNSLERR